MSNKQKILFYLVNKQWVAGGTIELMAREWETKPSTIARALRELSITNPKVKKRITEKGYVEYLHDNDFDPFEEGDDDNIDDDDCLFCVEDLPTGEEFKKDYTFTRN